MRQYCKCLVGSHQDWSFTNIFGLILENCFIRPSQNSFQQEISHPLWSKSCHLNSQAKLKKNNLLLDNWRAITLLCNDYKLLVHVYANQLNKGLHQLIDECQSAFIKSRSYGTVWYSAKEPKPPPKLFILTTQLLTILIRNNPKILRITFLDKEFKMSQFVDDTSIFLTNSW